MRLRGRVRVRVRNWMSYCISERGESWIVAIPSEVWRQRVPGLGRGEVRRRVRVTSRSGVGFCDLYWRTVGSVVATAEAGVHSVFDIDPSEPANMRTFVAFELTQAAPQSCCLKDAA